MIQMKGKHPLQVKKGHIIHPTPVILHAICMDGLRVSRVSGNKIYYRADDNSEHYLKLSSIMFVCDTVEESLRLQDLSRKQRRAITCVVNRINTQIEGELEALMEASAPLTFVACRVIL